MFIISWSERTSLTMIEFLLWATYYVTIAYIIYVVLRLAWEHWRWYPCMCSRRSSWRSWSTWPLSHTISSHIAHAITTGAPSWSHRHKWGWSHAITTGPVGCVAAVCFRVWHICCGNLFQSGSSPAESYFTKHLASGKDQLNTHIMIHLPDTSVVIKTWLALAVVAFVIVLIV